MNQAQKSQFCIVLADIFLTSTQATTKIQVFCVGLNIIHTKVVLAVPWQISDFGRLKMDMRKWRESDRK